MKMELNLGLTAAVVAWGCLSAEAFATGLASPNSQTYSAESIALAPGGNTVLIQATPPGGQTPFGQTFFYQVLGTTPMPPGVVVTFAAPPGNTFTNPGGALCNYTPTVVSVPFVPAVSVPVVSGNTIACTAPAGGSYSQAFLINPGPTGAIQLVGPDVATLGQNRYPGLSPLGTNPSAMLQITAQATSGGAFIGDPAALPNFALMSRTSFGLLSLSQSLLIDLTGDGLPANPPGGVFVTDNPDGTRGVSRSGFLAAFGISVSQNDLDARTGLTCINGPTNSSNVNCAAQITGIATVKLTGDFTTLTGAYLLPNSAGGGLAVASAADCTTTAPSNAILGTVDAKKRIITFATITTPSTTTQVTSPFGVTSTQPVFSVCLLTNGTQVIQPDTNVRWVVSVDFGGGVKDVLTPSPNGEFGSITYEGSTFFVQNVFGANNLYPTFFRAVNSSNAPVTVWAVLTKDVNNVVPETGNGPCNDPGGITATCNTSFVANLTALTDVTGTSKGLIQPNTAVYYTADQIAALAGTSLPPSSLHATVFLLSPSAGVKFSAVSQNPVNLDLISVP